MKRRGGRHHPPTSLSTNKRPRVQPASRLLQESVFAWRNAADLPARERAALDHFALLKEQAHKQCQICQEAIRARLQHESIRSRAQRAAVCTTPPVVLPVATIPRSPLQLRLRWCPRRRRRRPRRRRVAIRTGSRPSRPSRASSAARLRILLSHLQSHLTVRCLALEEHCTKDSLFTGQTLARRRGRSTGTRGRTCQRQAQPRETLAACRMDSLSELGASLPHTARYDQHAVYP